MNRSLACEVIQREYLLCASDFRRTPSAFCWNHLEDAMYAHQWVQTRRDAEVDAMIGHLPDDLPPMILTKTIADVMREKVMAIDLDEVKNSVRKGPKRGRG